MMGPPHPSFATCINRHKKLHVGIKMSALLVCVMLYICLPAVSPTVGLPGVERDYCQWEKFSASCGPETVIVMETALYGRMKHARCIKFNLGYIGCSSDVLDFADMSCSGRRRCEILVPNEYFDSAKSCLSELTAYLSASYRCQKVITADANMCRSTNLVKVLPVSGFLSNLVPGSRVGHSSGDCGGDSSPHWLIEAQPGQRINITLWDFSRRLSSVSGADKQLPHHSSLLPGCIKYATITEVGPEVSSNGPARMKSVCGNSGFEMARARQVFVSVSSAIQVQMNVLSPNDGSNSDTHHFMLEYHMIGCADLILPDQAWFARHGDSARIGCGSPTSGGKSWTLTCNGTTWIGDTHSVTSCQPESNLQVLDSMRFPVGSSVMVIISLSLVIGFIILTIGLLYLCRRWRRQAEESCDMPGGGRLQLGVDARSEGNYAIGAGSSRVLVQQKTFGQLSINAPGDNIMRQIHRESNEYASIWEWPLPNTPQMTSTTGDVALLHATVGCSRTMGDCEDSRDTHGYYGTYETQQFVASSEQGYRRVEHPYQHPGTPSSGRQCFVKDDVTSARPRYFEINEQPENSSSDAGHVMMTSRVACNYGQQRAQQSSESATS